MPGLQRHGWGTPKYSGWLGVRTRLSDAQERARTDTSDTPTHTTGDPERSPVDHSRPAVTRASATCRRKTRIDDTQLSKLGGL